MNVVQPKGSGLGLYGMRERAELVEGHLTILSEPGKGTAVKLEIPLPKGEQWLKIIIADDHAVVRSGFMHILNFQDDMEVVATAADGIEAYQLSPKHRPDVLTHGFKYATGESGLIATGKIHEDFPETKILILTMHDDEEYLFHVLKNGASGYVLKNAPDEELLTAVRTVS